MAMTFEDLMSKSDEEIIKLHDKVAENTCEYLSYYLDELNRRAVKGSSEKIERMTRQMLCFTVLIFILTVINVLAVCFSSCI